MCIYIYIYIYIIYIYIHIHIKELEDNVTFLPYGNPPGTSAGEDGADLLGGCAFARSQ